MAIDEYKFESYLEKWLPLLAKFDGFSSELFWDIVGSGRVSYRDRKEFTALAYEIADVYMEASPEQSRRIRELVALCEPRYFWFAATIDDEDIKTKEDYILLRRLLAFESINDQGLDTRDAIVRLSELSELGLQAGIDLDRLREEIIRVSSPIDKYDWGSMQEVLHMYF